jgi:hypothetical protein
MTMSVTSNRPGSATQADRSIRLNAAPRIAQLPASDRSAPHVDELLCLNAEEAQFLMAAFARILEIASDETEDALTEMATRKLDRKLWAEENRLSDIASGSSLSATALYRFGIAAIEAHCQGEFGLRFHELPVPSQLAVLTQLDEPRPFHLDEDFEPLSAMLVVDAVESYFDVLADDEAGHVAHKLTSAVDPFGGVPWRAE